MINIINIIFVPFEVAFKPSFKTNAGYIAFDYIFDIFFLIDIIINLRTSYMDENGLEVFDPKMIAKRYIPTT
jgi:hypothetical protein